MRVIIEFTETQPWAGSLHCDGDGVVGTPFIGRLDLLRLLEPLTDPGARTDPAHLLGDDTKEQR